MGGGGFWFHRGSSRKDYKPKSLFHYMFNILFFPGKLIDIGVLYFLKKSRKNFLLNYFKIYSMNTL